MSDPPSTNNILALPFDSTLKSTSALDSLNVAPPSQSRANPVLSCCICKQVAPVADAWSLTILTSLRAVVLDAFESKYAIVPDVSESASETLNAIPVVQAGEPINKP